MSTPQANTTRKKLVNITLIGQVKEDETSNFNTDVNAGETEEDAPGLSLVFENGEEASLDRIQVPNTIAVIADRNGVADLGVARQKSDVANEGQAKIEHDIEETKSERKIETNMTDIDRKSQNVNTRKGDHSSVRGKSSTLVGLADLSSYRARKMQGGETSEELITHIDDQERVVTEKYHVDCKDVAVGIVVTSQRQPLGENAQEGGGNAEEDDGNTEEDDGNTEEHDGSTEEDDDKAEQEDDSHAEEKNSNTEQKDDNVEGKNLEENARKTREDKSSPPEKREPPSLGFFPATHPPMDGPGLQREGRRTPLAMLPCVNSRKITEGEQQIPASMEETEQEPSPSESANTHGVARIGRRSRPRDGSKFSSVPRRPQNHSNNTNAVPVARSDTTSTRPGAYPVNQSLVRISSLDRVPGGQVRPSPLPATNGPSSSHDNTGDSSVVHAFLIDEESQVPAEEQAPSFSRGLFFNANPSSPSGDVLVAQPVSTCDLRLFLVIIIAVIVTAVVVWSVKKSLTSELA